jgi:hypothetical protein
MADPTPPPEPSFKDRFFGVLKWLGRVFLAPGAALLVVVVAVALVALGLKNVQVGGILGLLFGKKKPEHDAIDVANSIPPDRVDANGKLIQPGQPDSKGMTQAVVVPIQSPGIFSNPDTVVFTPPGHDKPIEVKLPDGVKANDVHQVVVVAPQKFVVTVKDTSGIQASHVDDLLKKYS